MMTHEDRHFANAYTGKLNLIEKEEQHWRPKAQ